MLRNVTKGQQFYGWEAGVRTPIGRSRVSRGPMMPQEISNLALQIPNKPGKIRNPRATPVHSATSSSPVILG